MGNWRNNRNIQGDMTMWPFKRKPEHRNYTDAITAQILANAKAPIDPDPFSTAAVEIGAGVLQRAFHLADIEGATVDPITLGHIARSLVISGECAFYFDLSELIPIPTWEINGGFRRDSWRYTFDVPTPSGRNVSITAGSDRVVHPRYSYTTGKPWEGIGPIQRAVLSAKLQANTETSIRDETSGAVGYLLPIPTGGSDDSVTDLKADLKALKGKTALIETTAGGWGEGRLAAPSQDYQPKRIGPNPPASIPDIMRMNQYSLLAAIGVPVELVTASDGTGQREAWRRCLHGTIQPLGVLIASELSRVFQRNVRLSFDRLMASDIQGRARAFQSMVAGGMSVQEAAAQSALLDSE